MTMQERLERIGELLAKGVCITHEKEMKSNQYSHPKEINLNTRKGSFLYGQ